MSLASHQREGFFFKCLVVPTVTSRQDSKFPPVTLNGGMVSSRASPLGTHSVVLDIAVLECVLEM